MAGSFAKLVVSLGANISSFETDMKRATTLSKRELGKMERQAKQLNDTWNRNFKLAFAGVVAGLASATKSAAEFEKAMAEVSTLLDDTSGMDRLGQSVKDLSVQFGQAPTTQAKALYQIISAGAADSRSQIEQLTAANKLAVGGVTDVATAADGLTTVLNAYAGTGLEVNRISDVLFATMRGGKTTIGELSSSVGTVATIAAQTGVSFEELGAAVSTITKSGISTTQTMDSLRGVLAAVLKQSDQSKKMASELGVEFDIAALKAKGLKQFLADIAATGATEEQLAKLFGRVEALSSVMSLAANNGEEFTRQLEATTNSAGQSEEAVAKMAETMAFRVAQATAAFETLKIEIGQRFLSAVSGLAVAFVQNIDRIQVAIESLVALITGRFVVAMAAMTANFVAAAKAGRGLAVAMAFVGGPIGILVSAVALLAVNWDNLLERQDALGEFTRQLHRGFTILLGVVKALAYELGNLAQIALNTVQIVVAPLTAMVAQVRAALDALKSGNFNVFDQMAETAARSASDAKAAFADLKENIADIGSGAQFMAEAWDKSLTMFADATEEAEASVEDLGGAIGGFVADVLGAGDASRKASASVGKLSDALGDARKAYGNGKVWDDFAKRLKAANEVISDTGKELESLVREQEEYDRSLQDVLDSIYPLQAEGRRLGEVLALLNTAFERGDLTLEQFEDAVRRATDSFSSVASATQEAAQGIDMMAVAADEGARIMERIFQDLFTGIIEDSSQAFDAILDGFQSLIGRMNSEAARGIQMEFQTALGEGGGGFGSIDWKQAGLQFGQIAASAFADDIVRGLFNINADDYGTDYVEIGKQIGTVVGAIVGSFIPVIGTALGAIIGAFAGAIKGALFGKLFGRKFGSILGGVNIADMENTRPDRQVLKSPLADVIGISGQGGFGDLNDPETPGGKIGKAIQAFDQAIYDILKTLDASDEFESIVMALENWKGAIDGGANDLEALLVHRLTAITDAVGDHVTDFVKLGDGIEEQIDRFAAALTVEKLFKELPDALAGRTQAEFLAIVEKYATGFKTIGEAMQEVTTVFLQVVGVFEFLKEFSTGSLESDFTAILEAQNRTTAQALAAVNSKIFDAVTNFDGSVESLQEIAGLVASAREGELRLLMEIDAIQKGINSNLDKLKADILGVGAGEQTGEQIFNRAQDLIGSITDSSSAQDIAGIQTQFDALIRSIAPEDQAFMQNEIVALIELFRGRANEVLGMRSNEALDSAQSMRDLVAEFMTGIGDPLDIIAAAVEGGNIPEIMEDGLSRIDATVATIGPQVSNAIAAGFTNIEVTVNMQNSGGMVTQ